MSDTYSPKGNSKDRAIDLVEFCEAKPPQHLSAIVHRFIHLKTNAPLDEDYRFHALPDACAYIIFDQLHIEVTGITALRTTSEELNLGKEFHFVNIRFMPGVWQYEVQKATYGQVDDAYSGNLPLVAINHELAQYDFTQQQQALSNFVETLITDKQVIENPVTQKIFENLDNIKTVADMALTAHLSPRQLQRSLKQSTGFSPHDFLKVLRLQQSLHGDTAGNYADQSHFIHSFRKATGYTPARYAKKYDV